MGDTWSRLGVRGRFGDPRGIEDLVGLMVGMLVLLSLRLWAIDGRSFAEARNEPVDPKAFPWTLARGLSI